MKPKRNPLAQVGRALVRVVHPEMAAYLESEDQAAKEVMAEILEPEMAAHLESGSRSRGGTMKNHLRNWWAENHGWRMELLWDDMKEHLAVALGWLVLLGFLYVLIRPFFVGAWVVGAVRSADVVPHHKRQPPEAAAQGAEDLHLISGLVCLRLRGDPPLLHWRLGGGRVRSAAPVVPDVRHEDLVRAGAAERLISGPCPSTWD